MLHHKTLSPSSLPAKSKCVHYQSSPCEAGGVADKGSALHKVLEDLILGNVMIDHIGDDEYLSPIKKDHHIDDDAISRDDLDGIEWSFSVIMSESGDNYVRTEEKVSVYDDDYNEVTFGSIDVHCGNMIYDLKTGEIGDYRLQMLAYALGIMQVHGYHDVLVNELYSKYRRKVSYVITREEAEREFFSLIERIEAKKEPRKLCEHCGWCANKNDCEAVRNNLELVSTAREDFPKDFSFSSSESLKKAISALDDYHHNGNDEALSVIKESGKELAFLYKSALCAEKFLSGVKESIKKAVSSGVVIDGVSVSTRSGRIGITDPQRAFEISGLSVDKFMKCVSVSVSDISDMMSIDDVKMAYSLMGDSIQKKFLSKKTGKLLKTTSGKAFANLLERAGIAKRSPDSLVIEIDN